MRFSYAESMTDPSYYLPLARAAEAAGYDSMVVPDSICYPEVSDTTYPFNPDGTPGVPRGQALPRAVLADPGHGGGHRAHPLRDLRDQAAHPPARARRQAGELDGRAHRQPPPPRRRHQPVAGGLRHLRRPLGASGQAHGRGDRHHARAHGRRLLRVPRRGVRRAVHQDVSDAERSRADPDRRTPRGRPPAGRRRRRRLVAWRRRPGRPPRPARAPRRAPPGARHRVQAVRDPRDLARRLQRRRRQAARRSSASPTSSSASAGPTAPSRTPRRSRPRSTTCAASPTTSSPRSAEPREARRPT